jgi:hypothetical protein
MTLSPLQIGLIATLVLPTVNMGYQYSRLYLLLLHHGAESIFAAAFSPTANLPVYRRILTGDASGLDLQATEKFNRLRMGLFRAFEIWVVWFVMAVVFLYLSQ